jgi:hypothetical protein
MISAVEQIWHIHLVSGTRGLRQRFRRLPTSIAKSASRTSKGVGFGVFRFPAARVQKLLIKRLLRVALGFHLLNLKFPELLARSTFRTCSSGAF